MKTLKITLAALLISAATFAQTKNVKPVIAKAETPAPAPTKKSELTWNKETHDFGDIEKGKPVTYEFAFTNTSSGTILLNQPKASCGCTATNYTKTPIKPGEKGYVTATYNGSGKGNISKTITVTTNEKDVAPTRLLIKANVVATGTQEKSILLK